MTDTLLKTLAFLLLAGFLGILVAWVPRLDLAVLVTITLVLVAIDFMRKKRKR